MSKTFALALAACFISSCARIAVHFESAEGRQKRLAPNPTRFVPEQEQGKVVPEKALPAQTQSIAFFGLKNFSDPVDVSQKCPQGWGEFTTHVTGLQALLRVITVNLYSPWTTETGCRAYVKKPAEQD